jgi:hypothetical protein
VSTPADAPDDVVPGSSGAFFIRRRGSQAFDNQTLRRSPCYPVFGTFLRVPVPKKPDDRQFKVGDKIRVNLHHGKIEDTVVRAVIQDDDGTKLQVDVVGLDLTALY